jgi:plastocyanin
MPAGAADQNVVAAAADTTFSPATVTVDMGDTVTFTHDAGIFPHNVKFEDGAFEMPAAPTAAAWKVSRRFDAPGTYRYYCEQHGGPGGVGMSGRVVVVDPNAPPPPPDTRRPVVSGLAASSGAFARSAGALVKLTLSERARLDGTLRRRPLKAGRTLAGSGRFTFFGTTRHAGARGANRLRVARTRSGRRLTAGEYRLTLVATDPAGNRSASRTTRFFIRR